MSHKAESRALVKRLKKEGFDVHLTGSGHWEVRADDGERITVFPNTPSDRRWIYNALASIKRWKRSRGIPVDSRRLAKP